MTYSNRNYRLLVVDDDETDRRLYGWLLSRQAPGPCQIENATDGTTGLTALRERTFDCILLDFSLPDLTGIEFLNDALVDGELPCAVVLITGHGNEAVAVEAMKLGVQDYLNKDHVNQGRLSLAIARAVTQRELQQRLTREAEAHRRTEVALRDARERAERAEQFKSKFLAAVTHDLRAPLDAILGYARLSPVDDTDKSARLAAITRAARKLSGTIERAVDPAGEAISIWELAENCLAFVGPMADERGLSLRLVRAHDVPMTIVTDARRLRQILLNLLGNAVKFTDAGGVELRILASDPPGTLRIEVADTGVARTPPSTECIDSPTAVEGAGLGLAIAERFVGMMGGAIGHSANPAGGGNIFWLRLPAEGLSQSLPSTAWVSAAGTSAQLVSAGGAYRAPADAASAARADGASAPSSGSRILLVDDLGMNRDLIGALMCAAGHELVVAANAFDAVCMASEELFDLILMDVRMPEMDGLEAARQIRTLRGPHGQVPILALTAWFFPEQVARCRAAGMDGNVAKPVDCATLLRAVDDAIARCPACWTTDDPVPAVAAQQAPPRLDRVVLDHLMAFMRPGEVAMNLRSLRARKLSMLRLINEARIVPAAAQADAVGAAHALASTAGLFGFSALASMTRQFADVVSADAPEAGDLTERLREEINATLPVLDELMREGRVPHAALIDQSALT